MCGFAGYLDRNNQELSSAVILEMLALQRHRGPDDSGIIGINTSNNTLEEVVVNSPVTFKSKPDLVFGFNRLSILDLSPAGHQPMVHNESNVVLMMNGEVYNAFEYKSELEAKGFTFKGHSDTEVVLYLYIAYGLEGMLDRLNGMFALVIYDGRLGEFFLVRDRVGIKPLYVLHEESRLAFASEMKSFKALPDFRFELEESHLSEFLLFRNTINNTLFKNIVNVTPGTYWRVDSKGTVEVKTYYDVRFEGSNNPKSTLSQLDQALKSAVKRQMISDVKLGCQLSGGVDSSLITAYAAETLPAGSLEAVSIVFDQKNYSEKGFIDQVAEKLSLQSHQFTLNENAYLDLIDEAVWHFEQPLNHPNTIGIKLLSREAKRHVTVLLSGEGADEAFAGYDRFVDVNSSLFSISSLKRAIKNATTLSKFVQMWSNEDTRYLMQTAFGGFSSAKTLYPKFSIESALSSRMTIWSSIQDTLGRKKRKYELLTYLPDLLMRQDKMSMAHTIENRVPFLDNEVLSVALSCDDQDLVKKRNGRWEAKHMLKELCAETFGESFSYRDKMGFGIPLKLFFSSDVFQERWNLDLLPRIQERNIFNHKPLIKWMTRPQSMTSEQLDAVWLMIGFEIWAKQYLD